MAAGIGGRVDGSRMCCTFLHRIYSNWGPQPLLGILVLASMVLVTAPKDWEEAAQKGRHNTTCQDLLEEYAHVTSTFTLCALNYARPLRFCENCLDQFLRVQDTFDHINKNESCRKQLLGADHIDLVQAGQNFVTASWNGANCNNCYEPDGGKMILSEDAKTFACQYSNTTQCLSRAVQEGIDPCSKCHKDYLLLCDLFTNLTQHQEMADLCMDLLDMMNSTWALWGLKLGCRGTPAPSRLIYLLLVPLICLLPIVLYAFSRVSVGRREAQIMQQRRLAEQLAAMARSHSSASHHS